MSTTSNEKEKQYRFSKHLVSFLGIRRFESFASAFNARYLPEDAGNSKDLLTALILGFAPLVAALISLSSDYASIVLGLGALVSILEIVRDRSPKQRLPLKNVFSLTHIAFAIGCIPAVFIVILFPDGLYHIQSSTSGDENSISHPILIVLLLLLIASWAGITEELVFRGLLLKHLRRFNFTSNRNLRDLFAVSLSAVVFGLCHVPAWGISLSIAVTGIGFGLGLAYLVNNERVWPLAVYHSIFNFISLVVAWLSYRA